MSPLEKNDKRVSFSSLFIQFLFLLQIMFENYQFEGVSIENQAVLTLYAQGQSSFFYIYLKIYIFEKNVAVCYVMSCHVRSGRIRLG